LSITHSSAAWRTILIVALAGSLTLAIAVFSQAALNVKLVSRTSSGTPANGTSNATVPTALSHDGAKVVFQSRASNLPGGDGATSQGYVRNVSTGRTRLVSKDKDGNPSGSHVQMQGISANGRFVTFQGTGVGLPGANGQSQIWVYDLNKGRIAIASKANDGTVGDGPSYDSTLSADGRRVAFASNASNLPRGDAPVPLLYVRDLETRKTILVSKANDGGPASGSLFGQTISSDGRRVAFYSSNADLPGGDGLIQHVYVRYLDRQETRLVDRNNNGEKANTDSYNASISGNARFVVFESQATNLPGQTGNQVYVRDLERGKTLLAGRNNQGEPQDGYAEYAHLSGSGRYVQFVTDADNLPGGSGATYPLVYSRDMRAGRTRLVSRTAGGEVADGEATEGSISLDGRWVAFDSAADNLGGNPLYQNVFRVGPIG
jgi:Tol biopolymer transport system component